MNVQIVNLDFNKMQIVENPKEQNDLKRVSIEILEDRPPKSRRKLNREEINITNPKITIPTLKELIFFSNIDDLINRTTNYDYDTNYEYDIDIYNLLKNSSDHAMKYIEQREDFLFLLITKGLENSALYLLENIPRDKIIDQIAYRLNEILHVAIEYNMPQVVENMIKMMKNDNRLIFLIMSYNNKKKSTIVNAIEISNEMTDLIAKYVNLEMFNLYEILESAINYKRENFINHLFEQQTYLLQFDIFKPAGTKTFLLACEKGMTEAIQLFLGIKQEHDKNIELYQKQLEKGLEIAIKNHHLFTANYLKLITKKNQEIINNIPCCIFIRTTKKNYRQDDESCSKIKMLDWLLSQKNEESIKQEFGKNDLLKKALDKKNPYAIRIICQKKYQKFFQEKVNRSQIKEALKLPVFPEEVFILLMESIKAKDHFIANNAVEFFKLAVDNKCFHAILYMIKQFKNNLSELKTVLESTSNLLSKKSIFEYLLDKIPYESINKIIFAAAKASNCEKDLNHLSSEKKLEFEILSIDTKPLW